MKSSTAYSRLRAYSLWTLVVITAMLTFAALIPVVHPASTWGPVTLIFTIAVTALAVTTAFLSWRITARSVEGGPSPRALLVAHLVVAAVALVCVMFGEPLGLGAGGELAPSIHTGLVCGLALLPFSTVLNTRGLLVLTLGVFTAAIIAFSTYGEMSRENLLAIGLPVVLISGGLFGSVRLSIWYLDLTHKEIDSARLRADLAVAEERLRFSRDLHDIFGRTLTTVAVKSDLAAELAEHGRADAAAGEMRAVHALAQEALTEVRQVVAGYRTPELASELLGARSLLQSSGIEVRIVGEAGDDAPEVLAWVAREAVTNVLRHANATHCEIRVSPQSVEIMNDGAPGGAREFGSGLSGLRDRMRAAGGTLDVTNESGTFTVRAVIEETR